MIFTLKDKIYFVLICILAFGSIFYAFSILERRLELSESNDKPTSHAHMPFMGSINFYQFRGTK